MAHIDVPKVRGGMAYFAALEDLPPVDMDSCLLYTSGAHGQETFAFLCRHSSIALHTHYICEMTAFP